MIAFKFNRCPAQSNTFGVLVEITEERYDYTDLSWVTRNDMKTLAQAEDTAAQASALTGKHYVATETPACLPRFDVVAVPCVGDPVSYSFNGDTYPDGVITSVTTSGKIVRTDTGSAYYRRAKTGAWVKTGGTWSLVSGHRNERNPHF